MPSLKEPVVFSFGGGWATDFGSSIDQPIGGGVNALPYLLEAENLRYELNGSPRKMGGTTKHNTTAITTGGSNVTGIYDYWEYAGSSGTQKIVGHVGTVLYDFTNSGNISTGHTANAIPDYTTFDDLLIYTTSANAPRAYSNAGGDGAISGAPNFGFSVVHKNRVFAAGVSASRSTLYWCAAEDPEDWSGLGSGSINVNPDDGDEITAIASYRGELWIFKGPYHRSIHRMLGSAPTSSDPFRIVPFARGISAAAQRLVFEFGNDLGFMDVDGAVYSLQDTSATGSSYQSTSLSRPINSWLRSHVVSDRMKFGSAAVNRSRGYVVFSLSVDSATSNNMMLLMDFRFEVPRWAKLPAFDFVQSVATIVDPALDDLPGIMVGGDDGFLRRFDREARSIDGDQAYTYRWRTPTLSMGDTFVTKQMDAAAVSLVPKGNSDIEFGWKRDGNPWQTQLFTQHGGDVWGPATANEMIWDASLWGGDESKDVRHPIDGADFHKVQFRAIQGGLNEDASIQSFAVRAKAAAFSLENP